MLVKMETEDDPLNPKSDVTVDDLIRMEDGKVICSKCGIQLSSIYTGRRHFREKHLTSALEVCNICYKTFPNRRYLTDHLNKVHKVPYKYALKENQNAP